MKTDFNQRDAAFSQKAHLAAQRLLYGLMYPRGVAFADVTKTVEDLSYAVDRRIYITGPTPAREPFLHLVQERFRRPDGMRFGDITITEWNLRTGQPSEMYKLGAQLFVYGYYDEGKDLILRAAVINVATLVQALADGDISPVQGKRPGGDQSFWCLKYRELRDVHAVMCALDHETFEKFAA